MFITLLVPVNGVQHVQMASDNLVLSQRVPTLAAELFHGSPDQVRADSSLFGDPKSKRIHDAAVIKRKPYRLLRSPADKKSVTSAVDDN